MRDLGHSAEGKRRQTKGLAISRADRVQLSSKANEGKRKIDGGRDVRDARRSPAHRLAAPHRPAIRVRPAPRTEPPTDDELGRGLGPPMTAPRSTDRMPSLATSRSDLPTRGARYGAPAGAVTAARAPRPVDVQPSRPAGLPAGAPSDRRLPPAASRRFVASCVEVIGGFRPVAHLRPFCAAASGRRDRRVARADACSARPPCSGSAGRRARTPARRASTGAPRAPGRVAARPARPTGSPSAGCMVCEVSDGVAEVVAVLCRRDTVWAMARAAGAASTGAGSAPTSSSCDTADDHR